MKPRFIFAGDFPGDLVFGLRSYEPASIVSRTGGGRIFLRCLAHRQTLGCQGLAQAKTAPFFDLHYQFIGTELIRIVCHDGLIQYRKIAFFRDETVAGVAGRAAFDSTVPAELPPFHGFSFDTFRPLHEGTGALQSADESTRLESLLQNYPQFYYRELPDYHFYLP